MKSFMEGIDSGLEVIQVFAYIFDKFLFTAGGVISWGGFCLALYFVISRLVRWASEVCAWRANKIIPQ